MFKDDKGEVVDCDHNWGEAFYNQYGLLQQTCPTCGGKKWQYDDMRLFGKMLRKSVADNTPYFYHCNYTTFRIVFVALLHNRILLVDFIGCYCWRYISEKKKATFAGKPVNWNLVTSNLLVFSMIKTASTVSMIKTWILQRYLQ
eukprot:g57392.t1